MEAKGKTGRGQTMMVFEGQIKRLPFIPRVKRNGRAWSECFRRAFWPQNVGQVGGRPGRRLLRGSIWTQSWGGGG